MPRAKRRRNGEGSLWKDPKTGLLRGKVSVRSIAGKDHRPNLYQQHDESAAAFIRRFEDWKRGVIGGRGSITPTVGAVIERWLSQFAGVAESKRNYTYHYERFIPCRKSTPP